MTENEVTTVVVEENKKLFTLPRVQALLIVAISLILIFNYFMLSSVAAGVENTDSLLLRGEQSINSALEKEDVADPAISLIQITGLPCPDCVDLAQLLVEIKSFPATIADEREVDYDSAEGVELIGKYAIGKLPAVIIFGETDKVPGLAESWAAIGSIEADNALVLRDVMPVYLDVASGEYKGRVKLTRLVDSSCEECAQTLSSEEFSSIGVLIHEEKTVEADSPEGRELVEKYSIGKIPTVLLSEEINAYSSVLPGLEAIGGFEDDGVYVMRDPIPIYRDINSGELVGKVKLTYLTDAGCGECYNVNMHKEILMQNFGLIISEEEYVDVNSAEGQEMLSDYGIVKIPTVIISGDLEVYGALGTIWLEIGTIEEDGSHVFRDLDLLGDVNYIDLSNNTTGEEAE